MQGLPHFDALLKLRFLKLDADPFLQLVRVPKRIERQNRDTSALQGPQPLDALHGRRFVRAVWTDQPKDLAC